MNLTKTLLTFSFCAFLGAKAIAQPVVTSTNMYVIGDTRTDFIADTNNVDYGTGGANKTWDYSSIRMTSSSPDSIVTQYVAPSSTPYASNFPGATVSNKSVGGNAYTYMKYDNSTSTATLLGIAQDAGGTTLIETYDKPELIAKFPINSSYNTTNTFSATYIANGFTIYRTGSVVMKADGYGTLKLPRNTYNNVLRLYNHVVTSDSFYYQGSSSVETVITDGYAFETPGIKNTLLSISRNDIYQDGFHVSGGKSVMYYDRGKTGITEKTNFVAGSVKVFPNPVQNQCTLFVESDNYTPAVITVSNMMGQVVKTYADLSLRNGSNSFTIDMSTYEKGFYFVRLSADGQSTSQKILVQ
jgi:hypothetical protein